MAPTSTALAPFLSSKRRPSRNSLLLKNWRSSFKKEVNRAVSAEDAEAVMEAVEADMAVAEEAAADLEDNEAVAEDSVEAAAVPLAAVVEADQCAAAAWAEAVVDHSPTENS